MTIEEFKSCKIGDIVICNTSFDDLPQKNWKGRIVEKLISIEKICVEWEKPFKKGHGGKISRFKNYSCRYYYFSSFASESETTKIIDIPKKQSQLEFEF